MGNGYMKDNENIYFHARKEAAKYNDRLSSRDGAAYELGVSTSTLADYELGNTKVVPVDKVVLMADLYGCPELKNEYCKKECPIGKCMPLATQIMGIEGSALRFIKELNPDRLKEMKESLINIAADGVISEEEKPELEKILNNLNDISLVISELKLIGEKALKGQDKT